MEYLTLASPGGLPGITQLRGQVQVSDIELSGLRFADHQMTISREPEQDFLLHIEGEQAKGVANLSATGGYKTDILLIPGDALGGMLEGQLPKVSAGTFRYRVSGQLKGGI